MNKYLIYKSRGVATYANKMIWLNMLNGKEPAVDDITKDYAQIIELENGMFALPKPVDELMLNVEFDSIADEITIKKTKESVDISTEIEVELIASKE